MASFRTLNTGYSFCLLQPLLVIKLLCQMTHKVKLKKKDLFKLLGSLKRVECGSQRELSSSSTLQEEIVDRYPVPRKYIKGKSNAVDYSDQEKLETTWT